MKRYIRTKDGKIWDTQKFLQDFNSFDTHWFIKDNRLFVYDRNIERAISNKGIILKQSDTIEKLIKVGDLVKIIDGKMPRIIEIGDQHQLEILRKLHPIIAVYTLIDEKFVPVWTLEENNYGR